jgi:Methyltransferase FkbM domain
MPDIQANSVNAPNWHQRRSRPRSFGPRTRTQLQRLKREVARLARRIGALPATPPSQQPAMDLELMRHLAAQNVALAAELQQAREYIAHLRRIEVGYLEARDVLDQREAALELANHELKAALETGTHLHAELETARRGAQAFVNLWQRVLFETEQTTDPGRSAATLVSADCPVEETLETLVNLSEAAHGARPFQYILPFLAAPRPFPMPWPTHMPPLRIVDVGSQELAWEEDMYAPLRRVAPAEIIGFDPFAQGASGESSEPVNLRRPDGTLIRTYPAVVADGSPVTLHVNRMEPTSSIFPSNLGLARQFGLLGTALETVETRNFSSVRLDDILPDVPVDLLKVDVQGASHAVLANAGRILAQTLVCHVEAEFAPIYDGERLFADIDTLLREAGFCFVDFYNLGRQRYVRFEGSPARAFHRGRTLWADSIYVRGLDTPDALTPDELYRAALIVHACYNKQDLAAELLGRLEARHGSVVMTPYSTPVVDEAQ